MRVGLRAAALTLVAGLLPACGQFGGFFVPFPNTVASVNLRGSQVVPALGTGTSGTATLTVDGLRTFIDYSITEAGLGTVTAVEIRLGGPGTNGPVLFTIPLGGFPLSGRLTALDFTPQGGVRTFSQAGDAVAAGTTYLLISTLAQPAGEIRGHIGTADLASAVLSGSQELPPLALPATGSATVTLDDAQAQLTVTLTVSGLSGAVTSALIFDGAPGTAGTTALFAVSTGPVATSVTVVLTSGDFTASVGVATFADAINALLSGTLHLQVNTALHPGGEIRGQIGPTQMNAVLTPADVSPPIVSTASGAATIALNATQTAFFVTLTHTVASPVDVGIYAENPGSNGPKIFDVSAIAGAATSPLSATETPLRLVPNAGQGILTFTDAINAILTDRTYIQVTSASFTAGEIRGQILP